MKHCWMGLPALEALKPVLSSFSPAVLTFQWDALHDPNFGGGGLQAKMSSILAENHRKALHLCERRNV